MALICITGLRECDGCGECREYMAAESGNNTEPAEEESTLSGFEIHKNVMADMFESNAD